MHIAVVLYGQPRDYQKGYAAIRGFLDRQTDCTADLFYHVWTIGDNQTYDHAPWRSIPASELVHTSASIDHLKALYSPRAYRCDDQTTTPVHPEQYVHTAAYRSSAPVKQNNLSNLLYQMFSRTRARDLVAAYVAQTQTHYDAVLMTRFDIRTMPDVVLSTLDLTKTYVSDIHRPRSILPDNCILSPLPVFLSWFRIYDTMPSWISNLQLTTKMHYLNEPMRINGEEMILASYLASGHSLADVRYFKGGVI
jgi:hypothetical protein